MNIDIVILLSIGALAFIGWFGAFLLAGHLSIKAAMRYYHIAVWLPIVTWICIFSVACATLHDHPSWGHFIWSVVAMLGLLPALGMMFFLRDLYSEYYDTGAIVEFRH